MLYLDGTRPLTWAAQQAPDTLWGEEDEQKEGSEEMAKYPCPLINGLCEYGGSKYYDYGFMRGNAAYCRMRKAWVSDMKKCPKDLEALRDEEGMEEEETMEGGNRLCAFPA